jgi:hypothetical protein
MRRRKLLVALAGLAVVVARVPSPGGVTTAKGQAH